MCVCVFEDGLMVGKTIRISRIVNIRGPSCDFVAVERFKQINFVRAVCGRQMMVNTWFLLYVIRFVELLSVRYLMFGTRVPNQSGTQYISSKRSQFLLYRYFIEGCKFSLRPYIHFACHFNTHWLSIDFLGFFRWQVLNLSTYIIFFSLSVSVS